MLKPWFDEEYNAHRAHELQQEMRRRQAREELEERLSFWKGMTVMLAALLFIVVCVVATYGWS